MNWRAGTERELERGVDQRVLRMNEYCMARRVLMAEVSGGQV